MENLKIKGIKKIAGESKNLGGYYSGEYLQLNYDTKTGEAWTDYHTSFGQNSWTEYNNSTIINCGNICNPITMEEIREMIKDKLEMINRMKLI